MTPAYAVLALLAVLLIGLPVAVITLRIVGTRLIGRRASAREIEHADDAAALGLIELGGFASAGDLRSMSATERRFLARAGGPRLVGAHDPLEPMTPDVARRATEREVPVGAFFLVCPACGASLGASADIAHYVGSCPSCSRRVATRRRGSRVALTALDATRSGDRSGNPRA